MKPIQIGLIGLDTWTVSPSIVRAETAGETVRRAIKAIRGKEEAD